MEEVQELRRLCSLVKVDESLKKYILKLVRATREDEEITLGVSPRGTVTLHQATQALGFLSGRNYAIPDDVKFLVPYVLSHRLITVGGRQTKTVVERLLGSITVS